MLLHLVSKMPIAIDQDEIFVGNRSLLPRMGVIAPEGAVNWIDGELDTLPSRPQDPFNISPDQIRELREEIFPYWRGKTLEDMVEARLTNEVKAAEQGKAFKLNQTDHAQGHILPDVPAWLRLGITGLRAQVRAAQQANQQNAIFYQSVLITLDAASEFILRYARLADDAICNGDGSRPAKRACLHLEHLSVAGGKSSARFSRSSAIRLVSFRTAAD